MQGRNEDIYPSAHVLIQQKYQFLRRYLAKDPARETFAQQCKLRVRTKVNNCPISIGANRGQPPMWKK